MSESDTILDALVAEEIPHTHVCGGNAYCSTCRVIILDDNQHCSRPIAVEKALAKKLDFPVHIRLACQTRISGDVSIRRLVLNDEDIDYDFLSLCRANPANNAEIIPIAR